MTKVEEMDQLLAQLEHLSDEFKGVAGGSRAWREAGQEGAGRWGAHHLCAGELQGDGSTS